MEKELTYLTTWQQIWDGMIDQTRQFLHAQQATHKAYSQNRKERTELGFNAFALASDTYYRENYHSYILHALLNPKSKHGEGNLYLKYFIDLVNACGKVEKIEYADFATAQVRREWNDMDVLIVDDNSRNAILIENKIFDAVDQPRQLPRYYDILVEHQYKVRAIVYLPLKADKRPSHLGWSEEDKRNVGERLCIVPAYQIDPGSVNLVQHWIKPCELNSSTIDNTFILKQYGQLVKFLNTNAMDTVSLSKFFDSLIEENQFETAISIKNMMDEMPEYMAVRLQNRYADKHDPFKKMWREKNDFILSQFEYRKTYIRLDVWCDLNGYLLHIWDTHQTDGGIRAVFGQSIPDIDQFSRHDGSDSNLKRRFSRTAEKELVAYIDELLEKFKVLQESVVVQN